MSYTIYHTTGIILGARNIGEANRMLQILTPDLGVVTGTVQSVREVKSKQRFGLQHLSYAKIDLVQGRDMWRIIGVDPVSTISGAAPGFGSLVRAADLIKRLVHGEESLEELFSLMAEALEKVNLQKIPHHLVSAFESVLMLRILYHLGYWSADEEFWLVTDELDDALLERASVRVPRYVTAIRQSLQETQL